MEKKRRVIEWLQAVPGGQRVTKFDENHVELKSWWPDNHYRFDEDGPHLREQSVRWNPYSKAQGPRPLFAHGSLDGEYKEWYENGQLRIHSFYKAGQIHGECKLWANDGQIENHEFYNRGQEVKRVFFNAKPGYILVDGKYYSDD